MTSFYGDKHFVLGNHADDTKNIRVEAHADGTFTFKRKTDGSGDVLMSVSAAGVVSFPKTRIPTFSATASAGTSCPASTPTKIALQTEIRDPLGLFDNVTNYRFQPDVAGDYSFDGFLSYPTTGSTICIAYIYKNGSKALTGSTGLGSAIPTSASSVVSGDIYLNGTTDYVELWGYQYSGGAATSTPTDGTRFSGHLARAD